MCGIAGWVDSKRRWSPEQRERIACEAGNAMRQRGPDDGGVWVPSDAAITLSFRRLSVIDLSQNGSQPMKSADGRYTIVFNGEIYNSPELRREISQSGNYAHGYRGHSDTEVLLAAFQVWGVAGTLRKANGMFALGVWDSEERTLSLARDRLGEKPLYYGVFDGLLAFASELKVFRAFPNFEPVLDAPALHDYFRFGFIAGPNSIYRGIRKLQPGSMAVIDDSLKIQTQSYWDIGAVVERAVQQPFSGDETEAEEELELLLRDSIRRRMIADVPIGAFLSGGLDSSTMVAMMQAESPTPIRTFSIGFQEAEYNEAAAAKRIANHLGTHHTELILDAAEAQKVIPLLPTIYDEPLSDSSQIPTYLVSRLARQDVTVSLSGDGGDELFGGYDRYVWGARLWALMGRVPRWALRAGSKSLSTISPTQWERAVGWMQLALPPRYRWNNIGEKFQKLKNSLKLTDQEALYFGLVSQWENPESLFRQGATTPAAAHPSGRQAPASVTDVVDRMMFQDQTRYLCDDILAKVDRASMAVSLESRAPYLDHRLVEFAWTLPREWKLSHGVTKRILRQVLYQYLPPVLMKGPKKGFSLPVDQWLRKGLAEWADDLLSHERLHRTGIINSQLVRTRWQEHRKGKRNWQHTLWSVLMFQAWHEQWMNSSTNSGSAPVTKKETPINPISINPKIAAAGVIVHR